MPNMSYTDFYQTKFDRKQHRNELTLTKQWLNRAIAASTFKYDTSLINKNEKPDSLRAAYSMCTKRRYNVYNYKFIVNNYKNPVNYGEHYIDGNICSECVPCDGPVYFTYGVTKMYTFQHNLLGHIYMINWCPITKIISYVNAFVDDNDFLTGRKWWESPNVPTVGRIAYNWSYSDCNKVDLVNLFDDYPSIVQDLINSCGAETVIKYIKEYN